MSELKDLIDRREAVTMIGVYDGFSARLVEQAGHRIALITGAGLSESRLGWPDVGLMGLEENLAGIRAICDCTNLQVMADGDTGYGGPAGVFHTVRSVERAGAAGVMLEDQTWPKRCGHIAGKSVISASEMVGKVEAAVEARRDPGFVIKARTDAAGIFGVGEAIARANRYAAAGADLVFADALLSVEDIRTFVTEVDAPVAINMGFGIRERATTPQMSIAELRDLGVAVVDVPRLLTSSALRGMQQGLSTFTEDASLSRFSHRPDLAASFEEIHELMDLKTLMAIDDRFGPGTASELESTAI